MESPRLDLHLASPMAPQSLAQPSDWWLATGDPVLARLITQGLSGSAPLTCEAAALVPRHSHGIFRAHRAGAGMVEAGYRYADHRARAAAAIAHAYVDVRKWQSLLALRTAMLDQYRDNAEIAHFRREAGLVSAIDGGFAGALSAQNVGAQDRSRARLEVAFVALAQLSGMTADGLKMLLSKGTTVPDLGGPPSASGAPRADLLALKSRLERRLDREKVSQASLDRALFDPADAPQAQPAPQAPPAQDAVTAWRHALAAAAAETDALAATVAVADTQLQALPRREAAAQRAVADARLAYRAGAGDFATLFVAEVAALGLREALVEARADRATAMIDLRTAAGEGWSPADLGPAAIADAAAGGGAACE